MQTSTNSRELKRRNNFYIFVLCLVLTGTALSSVGFYFLDTDEIAGISYLSDCLAGERLSLKPTQLLLSSFLTGTIFLLVPFVLGLCAVSTPVLFTLPILRGLGLGTAVCSLYYDFGYRGILIAALTVMPSAIITIYTLIVGIREASLLSSFLFSVVFTDRSFNGLNKASRLYFLRFMILEVIVLLGAAVDAISVMLYNLIF